jgi:hypothetical protein
MGSFTNNSFSGYLRSWSINKEREGGITCFCSIVHCSTYTHL